MTPEEAVSQTRSWLERFVIGLGLCPFAQAPFRAGRVAMPVCRSTGPEAVYRDVLAEIAAFVVAEPDEQLTSLVLVPEALADFEDYLTVLAMLDDALDEAGLRGIVQIASFHPDYRFGDAPADDPANYSNRSPVPMFHLIREDHLASVLEDYPDAERIPERNIRTLRAMGLTELRAWRD